MANGTVDHYATPMLRLRLFGFSPRVPCPCCKGYEDSEMHLKHCADGEGSSPPVLQAGHRANLLKAFRAL